MLEEMDGRLADDLRRLETLQEKVVRLHYGLGCARPHAIKNIARAFQLPRREVLSILREAEDRLAQGGWTRAKLSEVARLGQGQARDVKVRRHRMCRWRSL